MTTILTETLRQDILNIVQVGHESYDHLATKERPFLEKNTNVIITNCET